MKVLLTNFHPNNGGGHTTYLVYIFQKLTQLNDIDVYLAVPKSSKLYRLCKDINESNVFDVDFPSKVNEIGLVIKNTKKLASLIKKFNFDIIHANGNPDHKIVMYCKLFYSLKFKIIRTKHESKSIKDNFLTKLQYKDFMDSMIVVSNYQLEQIDKKFVLDKTYVIQNGVDLDYFHPEEKDKELLTQYNIDKDDIVLVSVAGTALHKGWQYLVEAVSKSSFKDKIKIIIAGNLPKENIVFENIYKFDMKDSVIFTGMLDDVRKVISLADIGFVLSTSIETISFACREMMAMSKPIIVSDYAGLPENIIDDFDGWIVPIKNSEFIKKILDEVFQNRDNLKIFSDNAYKKAKEQFTLKQFISKTLEVYYKD